MNSDYLDQLVTTLLRKSDVKFGANSFGEALLAHPNYPSLKTISDTLNSFGVKHYALRLEPSEVLQLEDPFIAHISASGGTFVLVKQIANGVVSYTANGKSYKTATIEQFAHVHTGAVLLVEPKQIASQIPHHGFGIYHINNNYLFLIIAAIALCVGLVSGLHNNGWSPLLLNVNNIALFITSVLGCLLSGAMVLHELNTASNLVKRICSWSPKLNCGAVLSSKEAKFNAWFGLADVGFVYFTGMLLAIVVIPASHHGILSVVALLALLSPVYSVIAQLRLKQWCPLCVGVQVILLLQVYFILRGGFSIIFAPSVLLQLAMAFMLPLLVWAIIKRNMVLSTHYVHQTKLFLAIKREPAVLLSLMAAKPRVNVPQGDSALCFGVPSAPVTLTAFLSLTCKHCSSAFASMVTLLANQPIRLCVIMAPPSTPEEHRVTEKLYNAYRKSEQHALDFLTQWYTNPMEVVSKVQNLPSNAQPLNFEWHMQAFAQCAVSGTPYLLVNGFELPHHYQPHELKYYIPDILVLTQRQKGQEAQKV